MMGSTIVFVCGDGDPIHPIVLDCGSDGLPRWSPDQRAQCYSARFGECVSAQHNRQVHIFLFLFLNAENNNIFKHNIECMQSS